LGQGGGRERAIAFCADEPNAVRLGFCVGHFAGYYTRNPGRADVVFNNYGTAICGADAGCIANNGQGAYDGVAGLAASPSDQEMIANAFTPGGNFKLSDVKLPLIDTFGTGTYNAYLTSNIPGTTVLESWLGVA
jgi:hypothetical protein